MLLVCDGRERNDLFTSLYSLLKLSDSIRVVLLTGDIIVRGEGGYKGCLPLT